MAISILELSPVFAHILEKMEGVLGAGSSATTFSSLIEGMAFSDQLSWLWVRDDVSSSRIVEVRTREMGNAGNGRSLAGDVAMIEVFEQLVGSID